MRLINIVESFLDCNDWKVPEEMLNKIYTSSLLPLIETSFMSGLLEMSKDSDLVLSYLRLV